MDLPRDARSVEDIPNDYHPGPLMPRQALIDGILAVVPHADFANPSWGHIVTPDCVIEVNIGDADSVKSFAFHVRGGDLAAGIVADILDHFQLRANDGSDSFDREGSLASLQQWRAYRDRVVGDAQSGGDG